MISDVDEAPRKISEVTRRAVIDHFSVAKVNWAGRLQDDEFLARLYELSKLPSFDPRYQDAADDIYQHCVRIRGPGSHEPRRKSVAAMRHRSFAQEQIIPLAGAETKNRTFMQ